MARSICRAKPHTSDAEPVPAPREVQLSETVTDEGAPPRTSTAPIQMFCVANGVFRVVSVNHVCLEALHIKKLLFAEPNKGNVLWPHCPKDSINTAQRAT